MARVIITKHWVEEDALRIEVAVSESYPDAVSEATSNALRLYAEALEVTLTYEIPDTETT